MVEGLPQVGGSLANARLATQCQANVAAKNTRQVRPASISWRERTELLLSTGLPGTGAESSIRL